MIDTIFFYGYYFNVNKCIKIAYLKRRDFIFSVFFVNCSNAVKYKNIILNIFFLLKGSSQFTLIIITSYEFEFEYNDEEINHVTSHYEFYIFLLNYYLFISSLAMELSIEISSVAWIETFIREWEQNILPIA